MRRQNTGLETEQRYVKGGTGAVEGAAEPDSSPLPSPGLPLEPPGGTELGLAGRGGPVLLELLTGGWNEPDRKMPSERGRGLRAVGGGRRLWSGEAEAGRSPYDFRVADSFA